MVVCRVLYTIRVIGSGRIRVFAIRGFVYSTIVGVFLS